MDLDDLTKKGLYLKARKMQLEEAQKVIEDYKAEFGEIPEEDKPLIDKDTLKKMEKYFKND